MTFTNGMVVRELIVVVDEKARRVVCSAVWERFKHYHASMQVCEEGAHRSWFVGITGWLPNELVRQIEALSHKGAEAMKETLECRCVTRGTGRTKTSESQDWGNCALRDPTQPTVSQYLKD